MAISGPSSYLPTTDSFIAHWTNANTVLGAAGPIILANNVTVSLLVSLRTTLESQRAAVESQRNAREGARADIENLKSTLHDRLIQFNGKLRSMQPGTRWEAMLPKAFSQTEGMGRVLPPLDELSDLWLRHDEEALNTILRGDYHLSHFNTDLAALKAAYTAYSHAEIALGLARGFRNETQATIYEILKQYRLRIPSEFAASSPLLTTLPRLTPLPGSTPDAVTLSGSYDETAHQASLAWTPVDDPQVTKLELRATAGPEYDVEDETIIATFPPVNSGQWTGSFGLQVPGAATSFKIYTLTAEGNERGSNPVTVTRPNL